MLLTTLVNNKPQVLAISTGKDTNEITQQSMTGRGLALVHAPRAPATKRQQAALARKDRSEENCWADGRTKRRLLLNFSPALGLTDSRDLKTAQRYQCCTHSPMPFS